MSQVSGVVLALCTPALIYLLDVSLRSAEGYERIGAALEAAPVKGLVVLIVWGFAHHFLAGIRHLLMDIDIGSGLWTARLSAWLVNMASIGVALFTGGMLL